MKLLAQSLLFMFVLPLSVMAVGEAIQTLAPGLRDSPDVRAVCFQGSEYVCD